MPAPIEIETPRIGDNINGDAMHGIGAEDDLDIPRSLWTAQQLPPGHVPRDGRVLCLLRHARWLLRFLKRNQ